MARQGLRPGNGGPRLEASRRGLRLVSGGEGRRSEGKARRVLGGPRLEMGTPREVRRGRVLPRSR